MNKDIPLTRFLDIKRNAENNLSLPFAPTVLNHVDTAHAGAQFCLAELASGAFLEALFPEYKGRVYAVVRRVEIKYKAPGKTDLAAHAEVGDGDKLRFSEEFEKMGRALISVRVDLKDAEGIATFSAVFQWYVQKPDSLLSPGVIAD